MSEFDSTSSPLETYLFRIDGQEYRYTSASRRVNRPDGTYEPLPGLSRGPISIATLGASDELTVSIPAMSDIGKAVGFFDTPKSVQLELVRVQTGYGSPVMRYHGTLGSCQLRGTMLELSFPDVFAANFGSKLPSHKFSSVCNWQVFQPGCWLLDRDYTLRPSSNDFTRAHFGSENQPAFIFSATYPSAYNHWWPDLLRGGVLAFTNPGQEQVLRRIIGVFWTSNQGLFPWYIQVDGPANVLSGAEIEIKAGCDQSAARCQAFGNYKNFRGFLFAPSERDNPIAQDLNEQEKR